jgi:sugar/nucleoside kinase (ribokinase family)
VTQSSTVLSLGEVLIDMIVSDGSPTLEDAGEFTARPGGAPANVAVALRRLGVPSAFCGAVGDDPFGSRLRRVLLADNVDTGSLKVVPGASTTLAFAWKNERGDGQFRLVRLADVLLSELDIEQAAIADRAAIIVGSVALTASPSREAIYRAVELASEAGVPVCFDVNMRPSLWESGERAREICQPVLDRTTILKLSVDDADVLFGLRHPDEIFAARVGTDAVRLLTDGGRGAWFRNESGEVEHVPAFPIDPVEPTGAGDAFTAAVVSRYLASQRAPNRDDIAFASAAGAITATRIGAIESLPTRAEIEQFLSSR